MKDIENPNPRFTLRVSVSLKYRDSWSLFMIGEGGGGGGVNG